MPRFIYYLTFLLTIGFFFNRPLIGQSVLSPGFDSKEYRNVLLVNANNMGEKFLAKSKISSPQAKMLYRSKTVGLENRWDFWLDSRGVGIISLRGTTPKKDSWLENFYAAMLPATGQLKFNNRTFKYKLSQDSLSYVHAGWLLGLSFMAQDIVDKINFYHKQGVNDFIIVGHSQGGALALLLRAYLFYLDKPLDRNIRFKTYASAAPKVGNLNFSYDFDYITRGGWAFRVVNPLDWVPQIPFSIQRLNDVSSPNPFENFDKQKLDGLPWYARIYFKKIYHKMDKKTSDAQEYYTKILGLKTSTFVIKSVPGYKPQKFTPSFNYVACGVPIILYPTDNYVNLYIPDRKCDGIFIHHRFLAYLYLLKQNFPERD